MLFILDKAQVTVGVANNSTPKTLPYFNDIHTESVDGISTFEFEVPADHADASLIVGNHHILKRDLDGNNLLFTIKSVQEQHNSDGKIKQVFCENTAVDELITDVYRPLTLKSVTLHEAVSTVIANAEGWSIGNVERTERKEFKVEDFVTVLDALNMLKELYSCEIYYTVVLDGTRIVDKKVNLVSKRGNETDVRFEYGKNLIDVSRHEDTSSVVTALVGVGKGESDGKRITLQDMPAFDDGEYYLPDKTDWIGSMSALQRWSKNGKHIFGIFVDDESETQADLKRKTIDKLKEVSQPYLQYSCSVLTLERLTGYESKQLRVGDRVLIKDTTFEPALAFTGRVIELKRSETNPLEDSVELGSYRPIALSDSNAIRSIQNTISKNEVAWNASSFDLTILASGGTVFKNGSGKTTLKAILSKVDIEVDPNGTEYEYTWSKFDVNGVQDTSFTHKGKTLTVKDTDVDNTATFNVVVTVKEG